MTKYSVKKPFTVFVGIVLVIVLGIVSFMGLNTDLLPSLDLPYIVVYSVYPGASPEKVETSVTKPLEGALATTSGLENISSMSNENVSMILMEFNQETNMDSAMIEISNSIDMVKGYLDEMVQPPVMMKINPDMLPVQMIAVDADGMDIKELSNYVENSLSPQLERIDGVAMVEAAGIVKNNVAIRFNQEKIDEINDNILKSVNSDLYKTKKELDNTRHKLEQGKNELATQKDNAYNKLAQASSELDAAQAKAQAASNEKIQLESKIKIYETAQQLVPKLSELRTADFAISAIIEIGNNHPEIGINGDTTLGNILNFAPVKPEGLPDEIWQQLENAINQLKSAVQEIINSSNGAISKDTTLSNLSAFIKKTVEEIQNGLKSMGISQEIIDTGSTVLLDNKLDSLKNELSRATIMSEKMESALDALKKSYAELEAGKMQTTTRLAAAQVELDAGKAQLDAGVKQFESARDKALKSANIDSLVTQETLSTILMAQNISMPAGYVNDGNGKITVKVGETFQNIDELNDLLLLDMGIDGIEPIHLKDVADVSIEDNSEDSYVRINGNPAITLAIQKTSVSSTAEVSKLVNKEIEKITEDSSVHITQLMDQGIYIRMVINSVLSNLFYGGIIAILILWIFLKDFKPTIIIGISIPISLMFAIVMMYFTGVSLNTISLAGLALGVGMLVDNSIVVIENVYRLRNLGYPKIKSAVIGAKQVRAAITSSTLTTICVFVPIVFTVGMTRQIFTDMALTIGYSLVASLIVALTVVPCLASIMLTETKNKKDTILEKISSLYEKLLNKCLDHKWVVITGSLALLIFSFASLANMPLEFIPSMDSNQMQMTLSMPFETSKEELISAGEDLAEKIKTIDEIETLGLTIPEGGIASSMSSSETKDMSYYIVLSEDRTHSNEEIANMIRENAGDYKDMISITESSMDMGALAGSGVGMRIKGNDLDILQQEAEKLGNMLEGVEGIESVDNGLSKANDEIRIEVNKSEAMKYGLTVAQVFQQVNSALTETKKATTLTFEGENMDAIIYAPAQYTKDTVTSLSVATTTDEKGNDKDVTLGDIATVSMAKSPDTIKHDNQSRFIDITATVDKEHNASLVSRDVENLLEGYEAPQGYSLIMNGENETIMSTMKEIVKMILLAVIFIYLIMVAQFQSIKSPFIVLFTIPLAFTGGILALLLTNSSLNITSMIGFLVLAGIVVNNGIVFVDYVNTLRLEGMDKRQALIKTGKDRIRPILMTALTTILAMSTMALGIGTGSELSQSMAIVTIGGLTYATLLTLFLVPALYDLFNRKELTSINVNFDDEDELMKEKV